MVGRTTRCSRINTHEPERSQVEFIDENVDHPNWVFFGDVIIQALRQQRDLRPGVTFNEPRHDRPRHDFYDQKVRQSQVFSHSLDPKRTVEKGGFRLIGHSWKPY
ncbi:hypothetical protein D3C81_766270 [compost metagenome]